MHPCCRSGHHRFIVAALLLASSYGAPATTTAPADSLAHQPGPGVCRAYAHARTKLRHGGQLGANVYRARLRADGRRATGGHWQFEPIEHRLPVVQPALRAGAITQQPPRIGRAGRAAAPPAERARGSPRAPPQLASSPLTRTSPAGLNSTCTITISICQQQLPAQPRARRLR